MDENRTHNEIESQQARYEEFGQAVRDDVAIFYCCLLFDIPFRKDAIPPQKVKKNRWAHYLDAIGPDIEVQGFMDGERDIGKLLGARDTAAEKVGAAAKWERVWGVGDEDNPYSDEDYRALDSYYDTYTARLNSAGARPDAQQEDAIRSCCKMRLQSDRAIAKATKESIDIAAKLNKMIQDTLSAEQLRKKDEKPIENVRIDSIVDALEKAGMMKKGKILNLPDLQKVLLERLGALGGKPSHKYPYTLDAADQAMAFIVNTMRANDGMAEIPYSPDNMCFDENVAQEFTTYPNDQEIDVYGGLDLVRWRGRGERPKRKTYAEVQEGAESEDEQ